MWFKVLSLMTAAICFGKGFVALLAPRAFYNRRRLQYASARIPKSVLVPPLVMLGLASVAWYATFVHYAPWSWLVTGFLSLISIMGVANLRRWSQHRVELLGAIAEEQADYRTNVDLLIIGLGSCFAVLALLVF